MTTEYKIYLVNNSSTTQVFWCFLAPPAELASDPNVFANSSTSLAVASMAPGINTFTIPVQYCVAAGASNQAVGLNIRIDSNITRDTEVAYLWDANYATVPPNLGPTLVLDGQPSKPGTIGLKSNAFNRASNEANGWFSSMSYGIQTYQGFIGMTWAPSPQQTRTLTPLLKFYVTTGAYGSNSLASWTDVSNDSAVIAVPSSFLYNKTTVTYTEIGGWIVTPGEPKMQEGSDYLLTRGGVGSLIASHGLLSKAHLELVERSLPPEDGAAPSELTAEREGATQTDTLEVVVWSPIVAAAEPGQTYLSGTLTVSTALIAAFAVFVLSGVTFVISRAPVGGTTVMFSYSGSESAKAIKDLFVAGAELFFS